MKRVLLITMPFGPLTRPAIGISLLKPALERRAIPCDIRYLNLFFAELVGRETYKDISESTPTSSLIGDWIFRENLFGPDPARDEEYLTQFLPATYPASFEPLRLQLYKELRTLVDPFLQACLNSITWETYGVVGFTTTFEQTVASLALARRIKERHPNIHIVFGGANCEGVMGQELARQFGFVDWVFSGESDRSFPDLVERVLANRSVATRLPSIGWRGSESGLAEVSPGRGYVEDLDELPYPDYTDFMRDLTDHGFSTGDHIQLLVETSRGCWWGQKHHCTFCGLNGDSINYRSKSPERVIAELTHLAEHYQARVIWATDNILDTHYFRTVLPAVQERGLKLNLFFETKSNLTKEQLRLMREVGLSWFQPGIETLNTRLLGLMRKGCTSLQNIQLLKWVRQYGMLVTWNVLLGLPGETQQDYELMARYCEAIPHLQPPSGAHPIRLDRFSPYFDAPEEYGITDVLPYPSYSYVYPFDLEALGRVAYFFVFRHKDGHDPLSCAQPTLNAIAAWVQPQSLSVLHAVPGDQILLIYDTRPNAKETQLLLSGPEREVYLFCDQVRGFSSILRHLAQTCPGAGWTEVELRAFLTQMVAKRFMLDENDDYLSLAVLVDSDTQVGVAPDPRMRRTHLTQNETPVSVETL
jgi:ribosomal peptide maturation radical SAM protein 1